eukprot:CAMPEP_0170584276 /NCGR_PEP_ID=MMETSP0224-20130122/8604_1 /TAXON_ID=285029 /ORGANISM="Togula jolla, Strain CCCM 725" /LENGTH=642 /DNA_ID=CAMNT_0010907703 /DNA_START=1 /DNA_END=1929 /DNA_ORIENTATION=-
MCGSGPCGLRNVRDEATGGLKHDVSVRLREQVLELLQGHQAAVIEFAEEQQRHIFAVWETLLETAVHRPEELVHRLEGFGTSLREEVTDDEELEALSKDDPEVLTGDLPFPSENINEREIDFSRRISPNSSKAYVSSAASALYRIATGHSNNVVEKHVSDQAVGAKLYHPKSKAGASTLDLFIGIVILVNVVVTVLHLEWTGMVLRAEVGLSQFRGDPERHASTFLVLEHTFNAIYIFELTIRLALERWRYFRAVSNWFDVLLVIGSSVALYMPFISEYAGNLIILRTFRLFKTVRAFRTARLLKLIRGFRILVKTVLSGLKTLGWSLMLLGMVILVCGLAICELVQLEIRDTSFDSETRQWMWHYYGSAARASYTMFEILNAGSWPTFVRPLFEKVSWWYVVFILLYVTFVVFAMKTIISALFLKDTLNAASQDLEDVIAETMKKKKAYMNKLRTFFQEADTSGDGCLSKEEFEVIMSNPKVTSWLQILELEVVESGMLFNLLAEDTGQVTIEQFMQGVGRLKGLSRSIDTISIQRDINKLQDSTQGIMAMLKALSMRRQGAVSEMSWESSPRGKKISEISFHFGSERGSVGGHRVSRSSARSSSGILRSAKICGGLRPEVMNAAPTQPPSTPGVHLPQPL